MSGNGFTVSNSKVKTYRRCQYAYYLKYVDKLRKKKKSRPLQFGTMVHKIVELDASGDDWRTVIEEVDVESMKLFEAERDVYGDLLDDLDVIMSEYFIKWKGHVDFIRLNKRSAEHEFTVEVEDGLNVTGKIDAFVRTPNRLKWLMEHKTFSRIPNEDNHWRNTQSVLYTRITDMLGWVKIDGVLWDYIHSKPPARPQVLKSGALSKKRIYSLPTRVTQSIKEAGARPRDYQKLIDDAANNRRNYFQRIFTPTKKEVVDLVFKDFIDTAREIRDTHGKRKSKNIDRHCDWCEYEPLCRAELRLMDVDYVKERDYDVSQKPDVQEPIVE